MPRSAEAGAVRPTGDVQGCTGRRSASVAEAMDGGAGHPAVRRIGSDVYQVTPVDKV